MLLIDKVVLVTGVLTPSSIAFTCARLAQEQGATVILTSFGRALLVTERAARRLPTTPRSSSSTSPIPTASPPSPATSSPPRATWPATSAPTASG